VNSKEGGGRNQRRGSFSELGDTSKRRIDCKEGQENWQLKSGEKIQEKERGGREKERRKVVPRFYWFETIPGDQRRNLL